MNDTPDPAGTDQPEPTERGEYRAQDLMRIHPLVLRNRNKQVVYAISCPPGAVYGGLLSYSRWAVMPLPHRSQPTPPALIRDGFYDYAPLADAPSDTGAFEWHVHFADPILFVSYGSQLFAQDELQVAEHPALAALKERLDAEGRPGRTVRGDRPTPILVMGVERRVAIATDRNAEAGQPDGLYGAPFRDASEETVRRAVSVLDPPTITNLIALCAPWGGRGRYSAAEIEFVLETAFTGFRAAVLESRRVGGNGAQVAVHTGFWGCGVFGGDPILMSLLQLRAAALAGVDRIAFHVGDPDRRASVERAQAIDRDLADAAPAALIGRVEAMSFEWGVGDGN